MLHQEPSFCDSDQLFVLKVLSTMHNELHSLMCKSVTTVLVHSARVQRESSAEYS